MSDQFDAKAFLKTVTSQPGVYRMYDAGGTVIYVGKAKDLKNGFPAISVATRFAQNRSAGRPDPAN